MTPTTTRPPTGGSLLTLGLAPAMLLASVVLWAWSSAAGGLGPLDRAQFGWLVVVPLFLLAPAAAGLAARSVGRRTAGLTILGIGLAIGGLVIWSLAWQVTVLDCRPNPMPFIVAIRAVPVAVAAGIGFIVAGWSALAVQARFGPLAAIGTAAGLAIAGGALTLLAFWASFPALSCAAPQ